MKLLKRQKIALAGLALYWPILFIGTHISYQPRWVNQLGNFDSFDKVLHCLAYFILALLAWFATNRHERLDWRRVSLWWTIAAIVVYAGLDEFLQQYVEGRASDVKDFAADMTGSVAAFLLVWLTSLLISKYKTAPAKPL